MSVTLKECVRTAYATKEAARAKIAQIRRGRARSKGVPPSNRVYQEKLCKCGLWHLTSRNGSGCK